MRADLAGPTAQQEEVLANPEARPAQPERSSAREPAGGLNRSGLRPSGGIDYDEILEVVAQEAAVAGEYAPSPDLGMGADQKIGNEQLSLAPPAAILAPEIARSVAESGPSRLVPSRSAPAFGPGPCTWNSSWPCAAPGPQSTAS